MPNTDIRIWCKRIVFLMKTHILTLFIMMATVLHIHEYVWRQGDKRMEFKKDVLVHQNYPMVYFIACSFWGFLWLTFFRDSMKKFPWWINFFLTACMAWLSFPLLNFSLLSAHESEWTKAVYITIAMMIIHYVLAMCRKPFYEFKALSLIKWSICGFVFSSLGIVLSIAWKSSHIDVIVAYFMILYFSILIVLFGRTIGSVQFYVTEIESKEWFYMILIHYNFMSLYSHLMLAMCKTRCVLATDLRRQKV